MGQSGADHPVYSCTTNRVLRRGEHLYPLTMGRWMEFESTLDAHAQHNDQRAGLASAFPEHLATRLPLWGLLPITLHYLGLNWGSCINLYCNHVSRTRSTIAWV
jgi:hypothetical protein